MRALRTGLPARCRRSAKALSIAARLGRMPDLDAHAVARERARHDPGTDLAVGFPGACERLGRRCDARQDRGRHDGAGEQRDLAEHEPPQQAGGAVAERPVAALRGGDKPRARAQVVDGAEHERTRQQDALRDQRLPVARLPERAQRRQVHDARDDPGREQDGDAAHGRAREARDDDREHRVRAAGLVAAASTSRPASPPIQIDAAARCAQSEREHEPDGAGRRGCPARPGRASAAAAQPAAPSSASKASPERRARPGRSSARAAAAATASSASTPQRSLNARPKRGVAHEWHDPADVAPRSEREFRRGEQQVDRAPRRARPRARSRPPSSRPAGRARCRRPPGAAARSRCGTRAGRWRPASPAAAPSGEPIRFVVAALSPSEGITNCGGGPGLGPTANVNAPRTGCPSAEMTRHHTRYQPCGMRLAAGTKIVFCRRPPARGCPRSAGCRRRR